MLRIESYFDRMVVGENEGIQMYLTHIVNGGNPEFHRFHDHSWSSTVNKIRARIIALIGRNRALLMDYRAYMRGSLGTSMTVRVEDTIAALGVSVEEIEQTRF